ncbi:MAG TPA: hypothetical protein PK239_10970 [Chitinophagales bacterium]|nr:hypothetical protein [Chitinophagales bacterium]
MQKTTLLIILLLSGFICKAQTASSLRVLNDAATTLTPEKIRLQDSKKQGKAWQNSQILHLQDSEAETAFKQGGGCFTVANPGYVYTPAQVTQITGAPVPLCGPVGTSYSSTYYQANGGSFAWQVWGGEVYELSLIAGNTYTVSVCGGGGSWLPEIAVAGPGGAFVAAIFDCTATFTASVDGIHRVFITPYNACGTLVQEDNGFLVITLTNATNCTPATCGNAVCNTSETYCTCPADCPCTSNGTFVDYNASGNPITSTTPVAFCENFVTGFPNPVLPEHTMFVPVAVLGQDCVTYNVSTTHGSLFRYQGEDLVPATTITNATVLWLEITQSQINASGGTTTVTFSGNSGACFATVSINWSTVTNYAGNVATTCPSPLVLFMYLEGAYNTASTDTSMFATLNPILPLTAPYNVAPWNAPTTTITQMPTGVVDWVLVQLLDPTTNAVVESQTGLLSRFGLIFDTDLNIGLNFAASGNYNVVVRHRNHLALMSSQPIDPEGTIIDMSVEGNIRGGTTQAARLGTLNLYGLKGGDINANGVINFTDFNIYRSTISLPNSYNRSDCNMDGNVNITDFNNLIRPNTGAIGVTPIRY